MKKITCLLRAGAKKHPHAPALISKHLTLTYRQLDERVTSTLLRLKSRGVSSGMRVGILLPNGPEYIVSFFALWRLGAVACLLSTRLPETSVVRYLNDTQCRFLLTTSRNISLSVPRTIKKLNINDCVVHEKTAVAKNLNFTIKLLQDATIIFTSGSTAQPKAALHSFGNHYYNALGSNQNIVLQPGDRWLLSLPLYHVGGVGILFRTLIAGAAVVLPIETKNPAKSLKQNKVTHISLVPTQLYRLLRRKSNVTTLQHLKAILLGGSPIPGALMKKSGLAKLPIYKTYGLTEMASQVATTRFSRPWQNPARNVKVLPFRKLKIAKDGEILVKGKTLFKGYVYKGRVSLPVDNDGWFKTGDFGLIHKKGGLEILGRKDNLFISGGENIQPEEIEACLCRHENILEAVVLPVPHEEFGLRPTAFLRVKNAHAISRAQIVKFLAPHLPKFKIPDTFYHWPRALSKEGLKITRPCLTECLQKGRWKFKKFL